MISFIIAHKLIFEYVIIALVAIGLVIATWVSAPIQTLLEKHRMRVINKLKRREKRQLALMKRANEPLQKDLEEYRKAQEEFHQEYERAQIEHREYQKEVYEEITNKMDLLADAVDRLESSDQEQLRQLMDKIYDKHIEDKTISYHDFERYQSLYTCYKSEGGNGKYAARWEEVQTWTKIK